MRIEKAVRLFSKNPDRIVNPYPSGSEGFNDFERAWVQCLKREAANSGARSATHSFANIPKSPQFGPSFQPHEALKRDEQLKVEAARAYAKAKSGG